MATSPSGARHTGNGHEQSGIERTGIGGKPQRHRARAVRRTHKYNKRCRLRKIRTRGAAKRLPARHEGSAAARPNNRPVRDFPRRHPLQAPTRKTSAPGKRCAVRVCALSTFSCGTICFRLVIASRSLRSERQRAAAGRGLGSRGSVEPQNIKLGCIKP